MISPLSMSSTPRPWLRRNVVAAVLAGLAFPLSASAVDLRISGLSVTQATQSADQAVPLIAERRALVRVFVLADTANGLRPKVRLQFLYGRKARYQTLVSAPAGLAGVPTEDLPSDYGRSWNVTVPAAWIKPGLKIVAEVDPDRRVRESNERNNVWPSRSGQAFDVRAARPFKLTLVPVRLPDGRTSQIDPAKAESFLSYARRLYPVPEKLDVRIHTVFTTEHYVSFPSGFSALVQQMDALRLLEGAGDRYYAGIVDAQDAAFAGMGWIAGKASVTKENLLPIDRGRLSGPEYMIGHELGHNLSLPHAPCGLSGGTDSKFPYPGAIIGRPGFDVFLGRAYAPDVSVDVMSYCGTEPWISDHNYLKAMAYRERVDAPATAPSAAADEEVEALLVWGRETENGWILEPAFRVRGVPEPASGAATVALVDAAGRVVSRAAVRLAQLDHHPARGFTALIPLARAKDLAAWRLELDGRVVAERRASQAAEERFAAAPRAFRTDDETVLLAWDEETRPMALLRDADTGQVLGFARGGRAELTTRAGRLEVLLSNGVDSVKRTFEVP